MCGEEIVNRKVVEFLPVVGLDGMDGTTKLGGDIRVKCGENGYDVGFPPQREGPHIVRKIIQNDDIVNIAGITRNLRSPHITMK